MKIALTLASLSFTALVLVCASPAGGARGQTPAPKGHLLVVGGGGTTDAIVERAFQLCGGTQPTDGLALWPEVIVDQHFFKRQRFNRLLACVLDHPELVGVGIDEKTAVVVSNDKCEVIGESTVLVVDARSAVRKETKSG